MGDQFGGAAMSGPDVISRESLETQVTHLLRRQIIDGSLALGTRLIETEIATEHDLSRGTIRAALRRLVDEGLVVQVPYTGYSVVEFSAHDIWELYTLRAALEGLAARLAAEQIDAAKTAELLRAYDLLVSAGDRNDKEAADRGDHELHTVIVGLAGHSRLALHHARIQNQVRAYIALSNRDVAPAAVADSHRELVEAICAGDAAAAERLAAYNVDPPPEMIVAGTDTRRNGGARS